MARINIITDSSAFFPTPAYTGHELVSVLPLQVKVGSKIIPDGGASKDNSRWLNSHNLNKTKFLPPSVENFCEIFYELGQKHYDILAIFHSSSLSTIYENANKAATIVKNSGVINVIDSNTFGAGLGLLVQTAAQAASQFQNISQISQIVRAHIPHIYTAFFLPNLRYLSRSGFLDPAQAIVAEMLGIIPFYIMDSGNLVSVQKARNTRQVMDLIFEFVTEFSQLSHIALLQGNPPYEQDLRGLKEKISNTFQKTPLSEHNLSLSLMSLLGPNIFGVVVMEETGDNQEDL
jgi:DegV family protein with EDD domain